MKLIYLIIFISCGSLFSQNPYHISYTLDNTLPTSTIYNVFQDNEGYIWFSSDVGVIRYDGYDFKHYNTDNGLGDNEIFSLFQDSQNRIWFLGLNGKLSYYLDGRFHNEKTDPFLKALSHQHIIIDAFEDKNRTIYFLFLDGHISVLYENSTTSILSQKTSKRVYALYKEGDDIITLGSEGIYRNEQKTAHFPKEMTSSEGLRHYQNKTSFFFASNNTIYKLNKYESFDTVVTLEKDHIIQLSKIDNALWVGTRTGLLVYTENTNTTYFEGEPISGFLKDTQGNYWITTLTNGVKFIPNIKVLQFHTKERDKINSIENDKKNTTWIGTESGLFLLDKQNKSALKNTEVAITQNPVRKIRTIGNTKYVISNSLFEIDSLKTVNYPITIKDIDMFQDEYILAAASATYRFSYKDFKNIKRQDSKSIVSYMRDHKIINRRTNSLAVVDSTLYLGTSRGLFSYSNGQINMNPFNNELLGTSILDIYYNTSSKNLWVATSSNGVIIITEDKEAIQLNTASGLNSNGVNVITAINSNTYFIGTNKGVNRVELVGKKIKIEDYNYKLHLKNEIINDIACTDNQMYLATNKGLLVVTDYTPVDSTDLPKIIINDVLVHGKLNTNISNLNYKQNSITISYTGISYNDFGNLTYEYQLNDDTTWNRTKNRQINFKDLSPKKYAFSIRVRSNSGKTSLVKSIAFVIKPPFWRHPLFLVGVLFITLFAAFLIVKNRMKGIKKRFEFEKSALESKQQQTVMEKDMMELQQRVFRLQMNPHFIFNALNTIKGYYSGGEIKNANLYISRFSKLLRLILDNDERLIPLVTEIEMLELYIQLIQLRYIDTFSFEINVASSIKREEIYIPPLLIQPIVENAVIHGMAPNTIKGVLEITFTTSSNKLHCIVKDNGIGYSKSIAQNTHNHQSKAIAITKERIAIFNQNTTSKGFVLNELENSNGTEIIITIPLLKNPNYEGSNY